MHKDWISEGEFRMGLKNGYIIEYDQLKRKQFEGIYKDGKREGLGFNYYDNGNLSYKGYFNSPLEVYNYNGMVNFIKNNENFDALKPQEVKIAGRDALRTEVLEKGQLYGYLYNVNIDDIDSNKYLLLKLVVANGDPSTTESVFLDEEVQNIINSIVISK